MALRMISLVFAFGFVGLAAGFETNSLVQLTSVGHSRRKDRHLAAVASEDLGQCKARCGWPAATYNYAAPGNWGADFRPYNPLCTLGGRQAPIDIATSQAIGRARTFELNYTKLSGLQAVNNGHSLEVEGDFGTLTDHVDDRTHIVYTAKEYHIHSPSEHRINGYAADMEVHIVHKRTSHGFVPDVSETRPLMQRPRSMLDGRLGSVLLEQEPTTENSTDNSTDFEPYFNNSVVAILVKRGQETNDCLKAMLRDPLPQVSCSDCIGSIDLASCFAEQFDGAFFVYDGSLTTPPCSERVQFYVSEIHAEITKEDLNRFKKSAYANSANNRPVQPRNGRIVTRMSPRAEP